MQKNAYSRFYRLRTFHPSLPDSLRIGGEEFVRFHTRLAGCRPRPAAGETKPASVVVDEVTCPPACGEFFRIRG